MRKQAKIEIKHLHLLENESWNPSIIFGICAAIPYYQLAYDIGREFYLNFSIKRIETETAAMIPQETRPASAVVSQRQISMWAEEEQSAAPDASAFFYECIENDTYLRHILYNNAAARASKGLPSAYAQIDFWWIVKGHLSDRKSYALSVKNRMRENKRIDLFEYFTQIQIEHISPLLSLISEEPPSSFDL